MIRKLLAFRNSKVYDIICSVRRELAVASIGFLRGFFKTIKNIKQGVDDLEKRRGDMKVNMISKEELADLIDVSKLKELTETLSGVEKYIPSASSIAALNPFAKKEEVVVVEKKTSVWKIVVGVIVGVAAVGAIAYGVYKYFFDDYDEDFLDDIDDEFEDEEDEEDEDKELFED